MNTAVDLGVVFGLVSGSFILRKYPMLQINPKGLRAAIDALKEWPEEFDLDLYWAADEDYHTNVYTAGHHDYADHCALECAL